MFDYTMSNIGNKLRRACDPFHNKRFVTFAGKLKDLPDKIVKEAIKNGSLLSSDSPESEVKCVRVFSI
jgi:hypothetical protein